MAGKGWWLKNNLENDGLHQWEGLSNILLWKKMIQTTNQPLIM